MSANKRRKVDVGPATPSKPATTSEFQNKLIADYISVLSAAALRKRLLEKQASVSAAESSDTSGVASPNNGTSSPGVNGKAAAAKSALKKDSPRTAEEVLLGDSGTVDETALYEATETVDEPPRKRIQLSSISPDSSTIQKKADGTAVLKFADSSEVLLTNSISSCLDHHTNSRPSASSFSGATASKSRMERPVYAVPLSILQIQSNGYTRRTVTPCLCCAALKSPSSKFILTKLLVT